MHADLVLSNGHVVSLDDDMNEYTAIAIKNGRIIALGFDDELEAITGNDTEKIDLEGKTVTPGFIDGHQHMIQFGFKLLYVDCGRDSIAEIVSAVEERAEKLNKDEWIIGLGFDDAKFKEGRMPHKDDFKHIENPVFITHYSYHHAVANETALASAKIDENTDAPVGGEIEKDASNKLTGVLVEKGMDLVRSIIPPVTNDELKKAIGLANNHYLSQGITAVHEAGMGHMTGSLREFQVFQELTKKDKLDVRVYGMVLDDFFEDVKNVHLVNGFGNEKLKVGSIKLFIDGTISGRTCAISEPYPGSKGSKGIWMMSEEEFEEKVIRAHRLGFQVAVHAIGDEGVNRVLNAFKKAQNLYPRSDCRHRVEHAGITSDAIIKKMKKLGVIPVPQPAFLYLNGDVYLQVLPPKLKDQLFRSKSFLDNGLTAVGSSDCPVVTSSVILGIYSLMSRKTEAGVVVSPEEKMSLTDALKMYTRNPAYAAFQENETGTLELGKKGDLTVLSAGFMRFSEDEIKETLVDMTIIDGKVVYRNKQLSKTT
jgi:hypothetical protein